jgi:hypothetical protein
MKKLFLIALLLAGCTDPTEYKCINGAMYERGGSSEPWQMQDGAPSHSGITPVPCVP